MQSTSTVGNSSLSGHRGSSRFETTAVVFGILASATDILAITIAALCSHFASRAATMGTYGFHSVGNAICLGLIDGVVFVSIARMAKLYSFTLFVNGEKQIGSLLLYALLSTIVLATVLVAVNAGLYISRGTFLYFVPLQQFAVVTNRAGLIYLARRLLKVGTLTGPSVLLIGEPHELDQISESYLLSEFGLHEVGRISLNLMADSTIEESIAGALARSRSARIERLVVAIGWNDRASIERVRASLRRSALPALLLPDANVRGVSSLCTGVPQRSAVGMITLQEAATARGTLFLKRVLDISVSAAVLLALAPLMAGAALAIRWDSPGPVIFRQRRNGFDGRQFTIFKFRSMEVLEDGPEITQAVKGDARVTRVGAFLRRTSIDELPQLFNVLFGHMSLVGPRPHALAHDNMYSVLIDRYFHRHHVKPGITGWAQINGARGRTQVVEQMKRRVDFDFWYIDHCSIWLDILILARTAICVLKDEAY